MKQNSFINQQNSDMIVADINDDNEEGGDVNVFQAIGSNQATFKQAILLLQRIVTQKRFDGIVWDTPFNYF